VRERLRNLSLGPDPLDWPPSPFPPRLQVTYPTERAQIPYPAIRPGETLPLANPRLTTDMSAASSSQSAGRNGLAQALGTAAAAAGGGGKRLIKKFRGTTGEDIERFLKNVKKTIDRNDQNGKYASEEERDEDHVAEIYDHCGSKVKEFLDGLDGDWEAEPDRVRDRLIGRYRTLRNRAWDLGNSKIDSFHQRLQETLEHYIKQALRMTDLCYGRDELYDQLTARFCRGLRSEAHQLSLITAMGGLHGQQGWVRFEACISITQGMVFATGARRSGARDSDSEASDSDTPSESSDSEASSDDDHDRRKKIKSHKKTRKNKKKRKDRGKEYGREFEVGRGIPVIPGYEEKLEELRKEKEEVRKEKEKIQKEKEEALKEKERAQKEKEETQKEKEKEEARLEKEATCIEIEGLKRQMEEMRELKMATRIDQPPYQGPLGYGPAQTNLIEAGRPEWMANPEIICYNCEGAGHYESRCWKPRVHPEIRAENIQRINAETGRRRPFQPRYGQPERRL